MKKPMSKLLLATMVAGNLMQGGILLAQEAKPTAAGQVAAVLDTKLIQDPTARQAVEAIQKKVAGVKGYEALLECRMFDPNYGFIESTDELTVRLPDRMSLKRTLHMVPNPEKIGSTATMVVDGTWFFVQKTEPPPSPERIKQYHDMWQQALAYDKSLSREEIEKQVAEKISKLSLPSLTKINLKEVEKAGCFSVVEYMVSYGDLTNRLVAYKPETMRSLDETAGEWVLQVESKNPADPLPYQRLTIDKQTGFLKELASNTPGTEISMSLLTVKKVVPRNDLNETLFKAPFPTDNSPNHSRIADDTRTWIDNFKMRREWDAKKDQTGTKDDDKIKKAATAFCQLCRYGTLDQINAAIAAGMNVNAENDQGMMPLSYAAANKDGDIVPALLKAGARMENRNSRGCTPLMSAVMVQTEAAAINLLKHGADVNAKDQLERSCLMVAAGKPQLVSILIKSGAKVNEKDKYGFTPLMMAITAEGNHHSEIVAALLKAGADVNAKSNGGETPLMMAASNIRPEIVVVLLKAGADVNAKMQGGYTPLLIAASRKSSEIMTVLVKAGADVNAADEIDGNTPLMMVQDAEMVGLLIKGGANVNAKNKHGKSVLNCAQTNKNQQVAEELIKAGAK